MIYFNKIPRLIKYIHFHYKFILLFHTFKSLNVNYTLIYLYEKINDNTIWIPLSMIFVFTANIFCMYKRMAQTIDPHLKYRQQFLYEHTS